MDRIWQLQHQTLESPPTTSSQGFPPKRTDQFCSPVIFKRRSTFNSLSSTYSPQRGSPTSPISPKSSSHLSPHSIHSDIQSTEEDSLFGIPFESLVRLSSPNDPFAFAPIS